MRGRNIVAAVAGALFAAAAPADAWAYSALYVFGDSLSDAGNVYLATTAPMSPYPPQPVAPYVGGQFSNGPIWAGDLSQSLGLGVVVPSLAGGNDYAFGGATTGYMPTLSSPSLVPTLTQQVGTFLSTVGPSVASSALYAIWIGSNDVFNIITDGIAHPVSPAVAAGEAAGAAATEAAAIEALAMAGAEDFLVPLVGDLGTTPTLTSLGPAASAAGTGLAMIYDAALEADLAGLAATPGVELSYLNTFALLDRAIADKAAYGFSDVTDPCYVGPYTGGGTVCADPNEYLFWDALHPTAVGQEIIAKAAYDLVPEPGSLMLLASCVAGIVALRRRGKRLGG